MSASLSGTLGTGGWYRSSVTVSLSCSDTGAAGCSTTSYCTDTANSCAPGTPYSGAFTVSTQGTSYVRYSATDGVGNASGVGSTPVRIDTQAPSAPGTPAADPNPSAGVFTVAWVAAADATSGVGSYQVERSNDGGTVWTLLTTTVSTSLTESVPQGKYLYRVRATDVAGNVGPFATMTDPAVVDTTPARLAFVTAPQTTTAGQASQAISVQVQNAGGMAVPATSDISATLTSTAAGTGRFAAAAGTTYTLGPYPLFIAAGVSEGSFVYVDTRAGMPTLEVAAGGMAGSRLPHTVRAASPAGLAFVGVPARLSAGQPSAGFAVEVRDAYGNATAVAADLAVSLATSSSNAAFDRSAAGAFDGSVTSVTVAAGSSSAPLNYLDRVTGQPTLTATATGPTQGEASLSVVGGAPASVRLSAAGGTTGRLGEWLDVEVAIVDAFGNDATGAYAIDLQAPAGSRLRRSIVTTDPATGKALTAIVGGMPGPADVTVGAVQPPLPGPFQPLTFDFVAGAAAQIGLTATTDRATACDCIGLAVQMRDASGRPAAGTYPLQLEVAGPSGLNARIRFSTLSSATDAISVSGWTDDKGAATAQVCSRAAESATVQVSSTAVGGAAATQSFVWQPGPLSSADSGFAVSGNFVQAGAGAVTASVVPRDACGALLGTGRAVSVKADLVEAVVGSVRDLGDGTYQAELTVPRCPRRPDEPPAEVRLTGEVDGRVIADADGAPRVLPVTVLCRPLSSELTSVAQEGPAAGPACHAPSRGPAGAWAAELVLTPKDPEGNAFSGAWEPTVRGAKEPDLFVETQMAPDGTSARLRIASDRCRPDPVTVQVLVNGVSVGSPLAITFRCLPVNAATEASAVTAAPADIPVAGSTGIAVKAVDTCGNPAFDRPLALAENAGLLGLAAESGRTDARGEFQTLATGRAAGTATVVATVDGVELAVRAAVNVVGGASVRPGCACAAAGGAVPVLLAFALAYAHQRRRRRSVE